MELNLDLHLGDCSKETEALTRIKKATEKKKAAAYVPTWDEIWFTGYRTHTGKLKPAIFKTKLTESDRSKLLQVKEAIDTGELGTFCDDLRKFTKTHALGLHKVLINYRKDSFIKKMIAEKPDNYILIVTEEQLQELCSLLQYEKKIGLDTETTGLIYETDFIVGVSLTLPDCNKHFYIPVRHTTGEKQLDPQTVFTALKPFLENPELKKVLHNAKFDFHMFRQEGIKVEGLHMDTIIAMSVLNENEESFALKNLATKYGKHFGFEDKSMTYEELFGKGGFQNTPFDIGTVYACKDTHLAVKFSEWIEEHFEKQPKLWDIYFNIENKVFNVSIEMETNGFLIDLVYAKQYGKELEREIKELDRNLKEVFGDINMNSNQQLAAKLYDEFGLDDPSGKRSVDADTLEELKDLNKGVSILLQYRELNKLLTTYIEPLPKMVRKDGRLHGQFNQNATVTGRYASAKPNLQNLPPKAREIIVAPEGKILVGIDYSQIEPRYLAHVTKDQDFRRPYLTGQDLYTSLAAKTFHNTLEECGDGTKFRKMMKTGLLATMYGTSNFTLAGQLEIAVEEAEEFIADFLSAYPIVAEWIENIHMTVDEQGFVEMHRGRKRRFKGHKEVAAAFKRVEAKVIKRLGRKPKNIWKEKIELSLKREYWAAAKPYFRVLRQSVNAVIQGSCALLMKLALMAVYEHCKKHEGWLVLATVHDEIIFELPETVTRQEIQELADIMCNVVKLDVPVKADVAIFKRWGGDEIKLKEWTGGEQNALGTF